MISHDHDLIISMIMERRFRSSTTTTNNNTFLPDFDDPQTSSENGSESPISGDDSRSATATTPTHKKRRSIKKRVVTVPIGDLDGLTRSKGEAYPPSDSWAWRKYGQKPIKGSPYPRGYYRCSSSKGCPARKQVERSRVDPTVLTITYAFDHNHSLPTSKHHHRPASASAAGSPPPSEEKDSVAGEIPSAAEQDPFVDLGSNSFMLGNSGEFSWLSDVPFDAAPAAASLVRPCRPYDSDVAMFTTVGGGGGSSGMREEDESLFADLDELPECSAVFRRGPAGFDHRSSLAAAAAPLCGSTR
ncbi:hypothetical protein Dimus_019887 [Dionaea muscipula]